MCVGRCGTGLRRCLPQLVEQPASSLSPTKLLLPCASTPQATELLAGMTPDAVRLDLCTHAYDSAAAAVLAGMPGASAGTGPWFNFPYTEAQLPAELRQR